MQLGLPELDALSANRMPHAGWPTPYRLRHKLAQRLPAGPAGRPLLVRIPGIRPGDQTAKYIDKILLRLTLAGAIYITVVCLLPERAWALRSRYPGLWC